ncbi:MAG: transposase [Candidatus Hydrogenedentes bacterium]|nr:transposase [Candidatus Hydrogenedentota bacterium]
MPHHITQRGNRREDVFFSDEDRNTFLKFLLHYTEKHALSVRAYCLMTNHIHLVAGPVLLMCFGRSALLAGGSLRGAQPCARRDGGAGGRLSLVERGGRRGGRLGEVAVRTGRSLLLDSPVLPNGQANPHGQPALVTRDV